MTDPAPAGGQVAQRPTICLCMIVKDEVEIIDRCLQSCRELIDHWVICDTGSTDGTQQAVRAALDGIPGELHERPWVDFGHNRSEAMTLARGKADYLLLIDADMTLSSTGPLPPLTADAYMLRQGDATVEWRNRRLVRGDLAWRYVGATHEYIVCDEEPVRVENLDAIEIVHHADGDSWADKYERDRRLLEAALEADPANTRATFYLAQTHRDAGHAAGDHAALRRAVDIYEQRAQLGGWPEEVYCSLHQAGVLAAELGEWPRAADCMMRAWDARPARLEAVHDLAAGLLERGHNRAAHQFTQLARSMRPLPAPDDILFVAPWVYQWGMLFQYSISAYWCDEYDVSIAACRRLLEIEDLPPAHRRQTLENMRHALNAHARRHAEQGPGTRVWPHAGTPTLR